MRETTSDMIAEIIEARGSAWCLLAIAQADPVQVMIAESTASMADLDRTTDTIVALANQDKWRQLAAATKEQ